VHQATRDPELQGLSPHRRHFRFRLGTRDTITSSPSPAFHMFSITNGHELFGIFGLQSVVSMSSTILRSVRGCVMLPRKKAELAAHVRPQPRRHQWRQAHQGTEPCLPSCTLYLIWVQAELFSFQTPVRKLPRPVVCAPRRNAHADLSPSDHLFIH
jgi:hypothetical protein